MAVLTRADAKLHLNIPSAVTTDDTEIDAFIASAEAAVSRRVGPLESTAVTARVQGTGWTLVLPTAPAVSLTSVTPYGGSAITLSDLSLDTETATVEFADGRSCFTADRYTVVYQAGRSTCPADLLLAVKEMVRHLWQSQRGNAPTSGGAYPDAEPDLSPDATSLFPWRVEQLLAPHRNVTIL